MPFRSVINWTGVDSTTIGGSVAATSTGNVTLISSAVTSIYVYGFDIGVQSTEITTVRLVSGSTTAEAWRIVFTAASAGEVQSARLAVPPPSYLFRTASGDPLTYEKGASSVVGAISHYSFAFWRA